MASSNGVESGDASLRQVVRGKETALDRAGFELAAAQRTARAMARQATTDPLTGLANRSVTSDLIAAHSIAVPTPSRPSPC